VCVLVVGFCAFMRNCILFLLHCTFKCTMMQFLLLTMAIELCFLLLAFSSHAVYVWQQFNCMQSVCGAANELH
jgi:hypothetical protein